MSVLVHRIIAAYPTRVARSSCDCIIVATFYSKKTVQKSLQHFENTYAAKKKYTTNSHWLQQMLTGGHKSMKKVNARMYHDRSKFASPQENICSIKANNIVANCRIRSLMSATNVGKFVAL
jgi:hypothetical protein